MSADPFDDVDSDSPNTGVHPASRAMVRQVNRDNLRKTAWGLLSWAGALAGGGYLYSHQVSADSRDAGEKAVVPVEKRVTALEQQQNRNAQEIYEARKDVRELQNVIVTHRRSERLDEPLPPPPDAGTPKRDGGRR